MTTAEENSPFLGKESHDEARHGLHDIKKTLSSGHYWVVFHFTVFLVYTLVFLLLVMTRYGEMNDSPVMYCTWCISCQCSLADFEGL